MGHLPYLLVPLLVTAGLYGIVTSRHMVHLVICVSVLQSSTYVLLLMAGFRIGAAAPVFADIPAGTRAVDPVVQSLMLTDIVVDVTVTALLLALVVLTHERTGKLDPAELGLMKG